MTSERCNWLRALYAVFLATDIETVYNDFQRYPRSSAMSSCVRPPGVSITDWKTRLHLFSDKIAKMTLKVNQGHYRWHN